MRNRNESYIGNRYGKLVVIAEAEKKTLPSGQKPRRVLCRCDCGKEKTVLLLHILRNRIISCGCIQTTKNGESNSPLHRKWKSMHERCHKNAIDNHRYFERGIKVCDEWNDYFVFKDWALKNGYKKHLQIDRIDNNKGYEPHNCRFVTNHQNVNNRNNTFFVNYRGEKISLRLLGNKLGWNQDRIMTVYNRIKYGWNHDLAIETPTKVGNYKKNRNKAP